MKYSDILPTGGGGKLARFSFAVMRGETSKNKKQHFIEKSYHRCKLAWGKGTKM